MNPQDFKKACAQWCTGVSIVTATDKEGCDFGLTLNSVTSVSVDPPLMLVCIDNGSATLGALKSKGAFCINILSVNQQELSVLFATRDANKFGTLTPMRGKLDVPVLDGCIISLECEVEAIYPGGDHEIVVGRLKNIIEGDGSSKPLLYMNRKYS